MSVLCDIKNENEFECCQHRVAVLRKHLWQQGSVHYIALAAYQL